MQEVKPKIPEILANTIARVAGVSRGEVTLQANLANDLDIDELDYIELITEVEEVFGMQIDESKEGVGTLKEENRKFITVSDLVDCIESALKKGEIELPDEKSA